MTFQAGVGNVVFVMAIGTIIHFHSIPRCRLYAREGTSPNVAAVSADAIPFIGTQAVSSSMRTMTLIA